MAGGAGAGKSFVVRNVLGEFQGLKILNNDTFLQYLMKKQGLSLKMPGAEKAQRDARRASAKAVTTKRQDKQNSSSNINGSCQT